MNADRIKESFIGSPDVFRGFMILFSIRQWRKKAATFTKPCRLTSKAYPFFDLDLYAVFSGICAAIHTTNIIKFDSYIKYINFTNYVSVAYTQI